MNAHHPAHSKVPQKYCHRDIITYNIVCGQQRVQVQECEEEQ